MTSPLTPAQDEALVAAIRQAEVTTSGEIRVHLEDTCPTPEPLDRAAQVFAELNMHKTAARNGVLFYMAWKSRQFAVIGDAAINSAVPDDFIPSSSFFASAWPFSTVTSPLIMRMASLGRKLAS